MARDRTKAPPEYILRKTDACRIIGLARPTLDKVLKEPDCPKADPKKGWKLDDLIAFVRVYASRNTKSNTGDLANIDLTQLRMKKLLVDVNKAEFAFALDKNQYVERKTAQTTLSQAVAEAQGVFQRVFEQELPPTLVGLTAPEIRMKLRDGYIEVLTELHEKAAASVS